jgi:hypothetical protein
VTDFSMGRDCYIRSHLESDAKFDCLPLCPNLLSLIIFIFSMICLYNPARTFNALSFSPLFSIFQNKNRNQQLKTQNIQNYFHSYVILQQFFQTKNKETYSKKVKSIKKWSQLAYFLFSYLFFIFHLHLLNVNQPKT